jgi:hypothetical protein
LRLHLSRDRRGCGWWHGLGLSRDRCWCRLRRRRGLSLCRRRRRSCLGLRRSWCRRRSCLGLRRGWSRLRFRLRRSWFSCRRSLRRRFGLLRFQICRRPSRSRRCRRTLLSGRRPWRRSAPWRQGRQHGLRLRRRRTVTKATLIIGARLPDQHTAFAGSDRDNNAETARGTVSRRDFAFIDPSPLPIGSRARARSRRVDRAHVLRLGAEAASNLTMTQTPTGEAAGYRLRSPYTPACRAIIAQYLGVAAYGFIKLLRQIGRALPQFHAPNR